MTLTDFDPEGEVKVVAAALYAVTDLPDEQLLAAARRMTAEERARVLRAYVGDRSNRRHKPGRAFERTSYRFDMLTDYGAFRDLQRHRLLTLEWQRLTPHHGYAMPEAVGGSGGADDWRRVMEAAAALPTPSRRAACPQSRLTRCPMAYRIRFYMEMNAREAMHCIELRTSPQGHPAIAASARTCTASSLSGRATALSPARWLRRPLGGRAGAARSRAAERSPPSRAVGGRAGRPGLRGRGPVS